MIFMSGIDLDILKLLLAIVLFLFAITQTDAYSIVKIRLVSRPNRYQIGDVTSFDNQLDVRGINPLEEL